MTMDKHENAFFRVVYHFPPLKNDDVNRILDPKQL